MTEMTEYPGMDAPLVDRLSRARHAGVMSLFAKKALEDAEATLREQGDEHHSLDELYDYRMLYNALAANEWARHGTYPVVKSWRHSDGEECFGGGWFIVVVTLPTGQVSNHYAAEHWDLFAVPEVETPPEYDGHDPAEAARRMRALLSQPTPSARTQEQIEQEQAQFDDHREAEPPRIDGMAPGMDVAAQTRAVRAVDAEFMEEGGTTRHWVQALNRAGYVIAIDPSTIRDVTPPMGGGDGG